MSSSTGVSPEKTKKQYVRQMTEKRREQNRRAQKTYREKLKQKVESLEDQLADVVEGSGKAPQHASEHPSSSPHQSDTNESPSSLTISFDDILEAGGDLTAPGMSFAPMLPVVSSGPLSEPQNQLLPTTTQSMDCSDWQMPHRPASVPYTLSTTAPATYMSGALATSSPEYNYSSQPQTLIRQRRGGPNRAENTLGRPSSSFNIPVPLTRHLTLTYQTNMSASIAIALSLGISEAAYLEDKPSLFYNCLTKMHFAKTFPTQRSDLVAYSRRLLIDDNASFTKPQPNGEADSFKSHVRSIKPPLRPRSVQFETHPSYLDCIIFPKLRENAVQASVDGKLDHVEFFLDIMHGGLVCWGSTNPPTSDSRKRSRRGMANQVPFTPRSWEAKRWFLKKWKWLAGTEEEEEAERDRDGVWGCSRFWWDMKGEIDSDEDEEEGDEGDAMEEWTGGIEDSFEGASQFQTGNLRHAWGRGRGFIEAAVSLG